MELYISHEASISERLDEVLCDCLRAFGYMRWHVRYTTIGGYKRHLSFVKAQRGLLAASKGRRSET